MGFLDKKIEYKKIILILFLLLTGEISVLLYCLQSATEKELVKIDFITDKNEIFYVAVMKPKGVNSGSNYNWNEDNNANIMQYIKNNIIGWDCDFAGKYEGTGLSWEITDNKEKLKLLFYFPDTEKHILTQEFEMFAKESHFIFHMNSLKEDTIPIKAHNIWIILLSVLIGMSSYMLIEIIMMIALGYTETKIFLPFLSVNILFQILAAAYLCNIAYKYGYFYLFIYLFLISFLVWIVKIVLYICALKRLSDKSNSHIVAYSLVTNTLSLGWGVMMGLLLPGIH